MELCRLHAMIIILILKILHFPDAISANKERISVWMIYALNDTSKCYELLEIHLNSYQFMSVIQTTLMATRATVFKSKSLQDAFMGIKEHDEKFEIRGKLLLKKIYFIKKLIFYVVHLKYRLLIIVLETVGHTPINISRYIYFSFLTKGGLSIQYKPSSIAIGNSRENRLLISQLKINRSKIKNDILRKWTGIKTEGMRSGRGCIWYNIQSTWSQETNKIQEDKEKIIDFIEIDMDIAVMQCTCKFKILKFEILKFVKLFPLWKVTNVCLFGGKFKERNISNDELFTSKMCGNAKSLSFKLKAEVFVIQSKTNIRY